jgi:regulatory associated protein of mTOR
MMKMHPFCLLVQVSVCLTLADGIVRLYRDYSDSKEAQLLTAWRVSVDTLPTQQSLTCEWHQNSGILYTCGYSNLIRVWDADEEMCVQEISTDSRVGKLSIEPSGNLLLAGLSDGVASLFDRRLSPDKG